MVAKKATPARVSIQALHDLLSAFRMVGARKAGQARTLGVPKPWPGVVPKDTAPAMAQDSQVAASFSFGGGGYGQGGEWDGYSFMGYGLLSDLGQIPEYRRPSEILANEMTRKWIELTSDGNKGKTDKIKVINDELERIGAREVFRRAFELDNFFGIGHIEIDLGTNDADLSKPLVLEAGVGKGSLKGLRIIEPIWTYPNIYNSIDPLSPFFYKPETWYVLTKNIHSSRLLTFRSRPVPDLLKPAYLFGGVALTQLLKPYVDNWIRTRTSVSDITHNFSTSVLQVDMGQVMTPQGAQALALRAEMFNTARDNLGLFILDKNKEGFLNVSAPIAGLDKLQAQAQEQMAAIAGIPLVKLFGITPSGLNASSDGEVRVFYDSIAAAQERIGTPHLRRLLDVIQMSKFGAIDPAIGFKWNPLWALDEKGAAEVEKIRAETGQILIDNGAIAPAEERARVAADENSDYSTIDVEDVPDLREEEEEGLEPKSSAEKLADPTDLADEQEAA